ncbi:quinon protein alcohol dehydrogenase-like superfamily [Suillus fuscotomentosus]|uniref:Quinon protein alcohol dehydrogenase-like superfamily n=1 Tax=Suillus fuscotomentosus TaxID=1912939 RepID=A0AAD4HLX2_9AGAM|nr:quinon protein alcohol dehydrogenase-like superfamily [Suillus fuscotomentosus]KAG1901453.1 quinon protein alcohol dehydrogenase-like superfamily [Suillus fuscotomentosus]
MAARFFRRKASTPRKEFEGHENIIWSLVFLHDNVHIVSASRDGMMRKWNCDTGHLVGEPWKGTGGDITALALSPNGKIIACGRVNRGVERWTTNGKMISNWRGHRKAVRSVSWSPNGKYVASGSSDGTISTDMISNIAAVEEVWSLSYSPLGDRIASGWSDHTIYIWNTANGECVIGPIGGGKVVTSLVWSGTKLYSASDRFARVFDTTTGQLLHRYAHDHDLYSVALSPKNNILACVGLFGVVQLWNTKPHKLRRSVSQDPKTIHCVSFSQDGRYLAYGGYDGKLTLWIVDVNAPKLSQHQNQPKFILHADTAEPSGFPQPPNPSLARRFWNMIS